MTPFEFVVSCMFLWSATGYGVVKACLKWESLRIHEAILGTRGSYSMTYGISMSVLFWPAVLMGLGARWHSRRRKR